MIAIKLIIRVLVSINDFVSKTISIVVKYIKLVIKFDNPFEINESIILLSLISIDIVLLWLLSISSPSKIYKELIIFVLYKINLETKLGKNTFCPIRTKMT